MRGKIGIVIGFAAGYVLGSRAGRERYEQIKDGVQKVWDTPQVQKQVDKAKELGKTAAMALPSALWDGAVKVGKAASKNGSAGDRLDAAIRAGKKSADDVVRAGEMTAEEAKEAAAKVAKAADS
ncbi:hypothetical protein FVP74_00455 [Microbacterium saccharophilum]|uniref:YtxH domain-containing protein n=1 Tax=Microbacterium saccharophilum TaxID=1213358 RepID=A0A5C8I9H3_9MICO|nr:MULTISPECIES: hypothetical protein [Microbacterium]TXK14934.1 hypothetical protein FVP74_00455 [Microbacterium saccharophilum]GEP47329.1 hypothetical protein MSA03_08370 [Microbacterium saccharophilum]SFI48860.1 hypothetical protein SAMN04487751_1875 [Microbacterium saccharophilum]